MPIPVPPGAPASATRGAPEAVDRAVLTHFHGDRALGLLDGDAADLPRAEVPVPAADLAFFTDAARRAHVPAARHAGFGIARRVSAEGWTLAGAHLGGFGRVTAEGPGFRIAPL